MNYLAHLFLSGDEPEIIYGNLLEDFMNGRVDHPRNDHLSEAIKKGVRLHRFIDTFTDTHPTVKAAKNPFLPDLGKYASVAIDVVFDHYLLLNWDRYTSENFEDFRPRVYKALQQFKSIMPPRLENLVASMIEYDWLVGYAYDEGLHRAFSSLNKKIKDGPDMTLSIAVMHDNYQMLNQLFVSFFDELLTECRKFHPIQIR
jgi:acyl carrier protein phosphodiesterase